MSLKFFIILALQAATRPFGTSGVYIAALHLYINVFTVPSFFVIILAIVNLVLVVIYFRDDPKPTKKKSKREPGMLKRGTLSGQTHNLYWMFIKRSFDDPDVTWTFDLICVTKEICVNCLILSDIN